MIVDLALTLGPGLLGLAFLMFATIRARQISNGAILSEHGVRYTRDEHPRSFYLYVGIYLVGVLLSLLALAWTGLWIAYILEYR